MRLDSRSDELDELASSLASLEVALDDRESDLDDREAGASSSGRSSGSSPSGGSGSSSDAQDSGSDNGGGKCHPAYDPCVPPGPDLDCADVGVTVEVDHRHGDPHGLDGDGDGWGCESY